MATAMIVLAGGSGSRVDSEVNKVFLPVADRPILGYPLASFDSAAVIDETILVVKGEDRSRALELVDQLKLRKLTAVVTGGSTRQESELAGLEQLAPQVEAGTIDLIAIHDGARPFASLRLLDEIVATARRHGGAIPALPAEERMYLAVEGSAQPLPAAGMVRVQTPQAFWAQPLLDAYRQAAREGFHGVDTAETIERFTNLVVKTVPGDPRNIKITFVEDFFMAEDLVGYWAHGNWTG
ncbi:MAG TPA: IspD/TarI family cytidylyltransferase [Acidimicrobiia bacterium]|nr:IspD/TarI family cytidylyltransferase [Acidimicrobiia bacterium]